MIAAAVSRSSVWWGEIMTTESSFRDLIREIEKAKGTQSTHEKVCAERYKRIDEKLDELPVLHTALRSEISTLATEVKRLADRLSGTAWKANWKAWALAGFLISILLGALAWTTGQLYGLEPLRVAAQQRS